MITHLQGEIIIWFPAEFISLLTYKKLTVFPAKGKERLHCTEGPMDTVKPWMRTSFSPSISQNTEDTKHTAKATKDWLKKKHIKVTE